MKALREVAGEIEGLIVPLDDDALRHRPPAGGWSIVETLAVHAQRAAEDAATVRAVLREDGAPVPESQAPFLPAERDLHGSDAAPARDLLWRFLEHREELLWTLMQAERGWEHHGVHAHRGRIPLSTLVHEINERDLETAWTIRSRLEALGVSPL